jgi:hypothetical protein
MTDITASNMRGDARHIVARLERLPFARGT